MFSFSAGPVGIGVQKLLAAEFSPAVVVAVQMTVAACCMWLVIGLVAKVRVAPRAAMAAVSLGVLHPGLFMITYAAATQHLDAVTAVIMIAPVPALTAIMGQIALGERLKPVMVAGLVIALVGLVALALQKPAAGRSELPGYLLGSAGIVMAAVGTVIGRKFGREAMLPWYFLAPLQVTGAAIVGWIAVPTTSFSVTVTDLLAQWPYFAYLSLGMTAASYLAYNFALSRLSVPRISIISSAGPAIGIVCASFLFDEQISAASAACILVILAGAVIPGVSALWHRNATS